MKGTQQTGALLDLGTFNVGKDNIGFLIFLAAFVIREKGIFS